MSLRYSVVVPVFNESANIGEFCRRAVAQLPPGYELLVCYDRDDDDTLPALAALPADEKPAQIRLVHNTLGPGVRYAIEAGMRAAAAPVVLVTMADLSDDWPRVEAMVAKAEAGADVVCASRYMRGGSQEGGPWFKKQLSRGAGLSLHWLTGLPTHDPTNSFKAYRKDFLERTPIETEAGFALGLELTAKCHAGGGRVEEVPAAWTDRTGGQSRFRLAKWLPLYLQWYVWMLDRSRRFDVIALLLVLLYAGLIGVWHIVSQHSGYYEMEWIAFERGNQLYRAQVMLDGGQLYRDVAFQYGPLAAYLHAGWCALAGIGITQTLVWHLFWSLVSIALGYRVFRRLLPATQAALYSVLLWVPLLLEPGGLVRMINAEHQTLDRNFLLLVMLLWQPPPLQTSRRAAGIGLALGVWQWAKFGGAIYAGAALVLVDVAWLLAHDRSASAWRRWRIHLASIVGMAAVCELVLATWCLSWATPEQTWEIIWPVYLTKAYAASLAPRWPDWHGMRYFLQFQFLPVACLLLGLAGWLGRTPRPASDAVAWIAGGFYLLGVGTYIRVESNFYLYAFALAPLAVWGLVRLPGPARRLSTLILLFATALLLRSALSPQALGGQPFVLPTGETILVNADNLGRLERLAETVRRVHARPGNQVVLAWLGYEWDGGGFIHWYEPRYPLRNYFANPAAIRPADLEQLRAVLPRVGAVVVYAPGGTPATRTQLSRFLPPDLVEELMNRFQRDDTLSCYWHDIRVARHATGDVP